MLRLPAPTPVYSPLPGATWCDWPSKRFGPGMPQWGWAWNCCCGEEPCINTCAGVGTVGSASGDECTACGNSVVSDDFSGDLSSWLDSTNFPGGGDFCTATIGPSFSQYKITSGKARSNGASGGIMRSFSRPALSGLCIQVKAKIFHTVSSPFETGTMGITLGYGRLFFHRFNQATLGRQSCVRQTGCVDPVVGSNFATFGSATSSGDELSLIFRDQGGGDEGDGSIVISICYQVNGSTVRVEEDVIWCPAETLYAGIYTSSSQSSTDPQWDDFEILTS